MSGTDTSKATELREEGIETELVRITGERSREDCRRYARESGCVLVVEL